jgi:endonuclease/exonuclease/phosphatase (EEP) superfamily protein YafD
MSRRKPKAKKSRAGFLMRCARFLLISIAMIAAVFFGLGYFLGVDFPVAGWAFETPMFIWAGACFLLAVVFAASGLRWWLILPVGEIVFCIFMMQPRFNSFKPVPTGTPLLTVMTYNVMRFGKNADAVRETIEKTGPDVLFIQEFKGDETEAAAFRDELFLDGSYVLDHQHAVFSRHSLKEQEWIEVFDRWSVLSVVAAIDGKEVRLCNAHLPSAIPVTEWQRSTFGTFEDARILRRKAREELDQICSETKVPLVIAGDFNSRPHSLLVRNLQKNLNDSFLICGAGFGHTWSSRYPVMRIDYVFLSDEFTIYSHEVVKSSGSDHLPVVVKAALNGEREGAE